MSQIHKRFNSDQVKELLQRYSNKEIERKYIQEILGIGKSRFFMLLSHYKEEPKDFAIQYRRTTPPRISPEVKKIFSTSYRSKRTSSKIKRSL